ITCWFFASTALIIGARRIPTDVDTIAILLDILKALVLGSIGYVITLFVLGALLSFFYLPVPRLAVAAVLYMASISVYILYESDSGISFSFIAGLSSSVVAIVIGYGCHSLYKHLPLKLNMALLIFLVVLGGG